MQSSKNFRKKVAVITCVIIVFEQVLYLPAMDKNRFISALLLTLVIFFIVISISRTFFNLSKLITERELYGLTDDQKRALEFGDLHYFLRFAQNHTKSGTTILFITDSNEDYYLSRYYLYPDFITRPNQPGLWDPQYTSYTYYFIYPANHANVALAAKHSIKTSKVKLIATYLGKDREKGLIYTK
jgi:hypothetical protein